MVYIKPFIKTIGILLLIAKFVKNSDQTIIQIIRKNKLILMFLINPSNCFIGTSKTITTSKMKVFVVLLVCGLQPSTVTKNSVLGVAGVLDPPLELYNVL